MQQKLHTSTSIPIPFTFRAAAAKLYLEVDSALAPPWSLFEA